jgi:hypothetical protein
VFQQLLNSPNGVRRQENIAAHRANLGGNVVNYDDTASVFHGMDNHSPLIFTRTTLDGAFHVAAFLHLAPFYLKRNENGVSPDISQAAERRRRGRF